VTKIPKIRGLQRVLKRTANAAAIECGYVQTNSEGEKIMNTYTNTMHPKKKADQMSHTNLFQNPAIVTIILTLVATIAVAIFITNRPVGAAKNNPAIPYSNALEMQYARPWLESQNKPVVMFGNALELQYSRPWLDKAERPIVVTGNAQGQTPLNCSSTMEMLYACKSGFGHL
jgi:hypothetical protein